MPTKILGDEYWDKKIEILVEISKATGWNDLDKEYWMKQTCATMSMILDLYRKMTGTLGRKLISVEEKIKEMENKEDKKMDNLVICSICGAPKIGGLDCLYCIGDGSIDDITLEDDQQVGIYEEDSMYDDVLY